MTSGSMSMSKSMSISDRENLENGSTEEYKRADKIREREDSSENEIKNKRTSNMESDNQKSSSKSAFEDKSDSRSNSSTSRSYSNSSTSRRSSESSEVHERLKKKKKKKRRIERAREKTNHTRKKERKKTDIKKRKGRLEDSHSLSDSGSFSEDEKKRKRNKRSEYGKKRNIEKVYEKHKEKKGYETDTSKKKRRKKERLGEKYGRYKKHSSSQSASDTYERIKVKKKRKKRKYDNSESRRSDSSSSDHRNIKGSVSMSSVLPHRERSLSSNERDSDSQIRILRGNHKRGNTHKKMMQEEKRNRGIKKKEIDYEEKHTFHNTHHRGSYHSFSSYDETHSETKHKKSKHEHKSKHRRRRSEKRWSDSYSDKSKIEKRKGAKKQKHKKVTSDSDVSNSRYNYSDTERDGIIKREHIQSKEEDTSDIHSPHAKKKNQEHRFLQESKRHKFRMEGRHTDRSKDKEHRKRRRSSQQDVSNHYRNEILGISDKKEEYQRRENRRVSDYDKYKHHMILPRHETHYSYNKARNQWYPPAQGFRPYSKRFFNPLTFNRRLYIDRLRNSDDYGVIDRNKTCPFLLRLFYKHDSEYTEEDIANLDSPDFTFSGNELQLYTWIDITMREIVTLVKDFYEGSRRRDAEWVFKVVSYETKQLTLLSKVHSSKFNHREDNKTLLSLNYEIGDVMLVSIIFNK